MTEITITNNQSSRAIVSLEPVVLVPGLHTLEINSQWSNVKNPEERHRLATLHPDTADLRALHAWLGTYLQVNADPVVEHLPSDDTEGGTA